MSLIYLASPYTHQDKEVMEERYQAVCKYAAKLMMSGVHVFSPIAHGHGIAQYGLPVNIEFWKGHCMKTLGRCDAMLILKLRDWDLSKGIQYELAMAKTMGLPIENVRPDKYPAITRRWGEEGRGYGMKTH